MSKLEYVTPSSTATANVLLYGPPKTGKSWAAGSAPGPILYLNADLPNATRLVHARYGGDKIKEVSIRSLATLIDVGTALNEEPTAFQTVVLDPVGDVHRRVIEGLSSRALSPSLPLYKDTGTHVERFCRSMCEHPEFSFVVVAHEILAPDDASDTLERIPYTGTKAGSPDLGGKLMAMVDVVGYTGIVEVENGPPEYWATLVPAKGRRGGDRFDVLGRARNLDLSEWVGVIAERERELAQGEPQPKDSDNQPAAAAA